MSNYLAALTLLMTLSSGVCAFEFIDQWAIRAQPDGTTFEVHLYGDKMFVDGYVIVRGSGGWYYYAELDAQGEYEASPYKVGIDDPGGDRHSQEPKATTECCAPSGDRRDVNYAVRVRMVPYPA